VEDEGWKERHSLGIANTRETTPTNVCTIGEVMEKILSLCDLLQITRSSDSALQSCGNRHLALQLVPVSEIVVVFLSISSKRYFQLQALDASKQAQRKSEE
jgi:hypothetical protein